MNRHQGRSVGRAAPGGDRIDRPALAGENDLVAVDVEAELQTIYGRIEPLDPAGVAELLAGSGVRWWIAGGRAARVGAPPRHHDDTDVVVDLDDLSSLRRQLAGWHLWEAHDGALRPLRPTDDLTAGVRQLWLRRDADHPWALDLLLHPHAEEWVFTYDERIRLPWDRALHTVGGIRYLRPEIALLHKAHHDRAKDRADRAVAVLDPAARAWLGDSLELLGHDDQAWAVRSPSRSNPYRPLRG